MTLVQRFNQTAFAKYLPAIFFIAGFVWDALTIGRQVQQTDLIILSFYLSLAAVILWKLARKPEVSIDENIMPSTEGQLIPAKWRIVTPYFLLQFLYGSLLSALFLLYFRSASHLVAWFWAIILAAILIGNEFLEHHYQKNTIAWTMFGLCAILLFNFILPTIFGSIHWIWFVISTLFGASITQLFYICTRQKASVVQILPTWILTFLLMFAYYYDVIPPVPLVRLDATVGTSLLKTDNRYQLEVDRVNWKFWRLFSKQLHVKAGEKVYCITAIFAPRGLQAKLYHQWQYFDGKKWVATPRIGFMLNGGRKEGYRGYTYKQNIREGDWRVVVQTEDQHTVSVDKFHLTVEAPEAEIPRKIRTL